MKNNINKIFGILLMSLVTFSSCSDWLDVRPKTQQEADEFYSTEEGFKSALAGVYITLCGSDLYGREMTFGAIGVVGQEWKNKGPYTIENTAGTYNMLRSYKYTEVAPKAILDALWTKLYAANVNVNTLLDYTELNRHILRGNNYNIIRGEALALRAFIHLDLLRMYAPYDFSEAAPESIPYVKTSKPMITPQSTAPEVLTMIIEDLDAAAALLEVDPILTGQNVAGLDDGYLANRTYHLNYYAVHALKARAYMYAGKTVEALAAAEIVITAQKTKALFPWVSKADVTITNANLIDRTFSSEHIFALNINKLEDYIKTYFRASTTVLESRVAKATLYTDGDYRGLLFSGEAGLADIFSKFWQMENQTISSVVVKPKRNRMPMLRISEMYYIAAECAKTSDPVKAVDYIRTVQTQRGLTTTVIADASGIDDALKAEYQKEFLGEGQWYFFNKRKGVKNIAVANANYVFPMPDQEIDMGQRE